MVPEHKPHLYLVALAKIPEAHIFHPILAVHPSNMIFLYLQFLGSAIVGTVDPANIQAILATKFDDFETGELRYKAVAPVLGRSIFSSDGTDAMWWP